MLFWIDHKCLCKIAVFLIIFPCSLKFCFVNLSILESFSLSFPVSKFTFKDLFSYLVIDWPFSIQPIILPLTFGEVHIGVVTVNLFTYSIFKDSFDNISLRIHKTTLAIDLVFWAWAIDFEFINPGYWLRWYPPTMNIITVQLFIWHHSIFYMPTFDMFWNLSWCSCHT